MQIDKETKEVLTEQKRLEQLTQHEGWADVRRRFNEVMMDLQNSFNIDDGTPESIAIELKGRKIAATYLLDFMRDIEGTAKSAADNKDLLKPSYIIRE